MGEQTIVTRTLPQRLKKVRTLIESAGNTIASVHFRKRENGELRKMAFRRHVKKPTIARTPSTNTTSKTKDFDRDNLQMRVLDVNKVVKHRDGTVGRGAWRMIPLEGVERVCVKGETYLIT